MGLLDKLLRKVSFDYCKNCKKDMDIIKKKLYVLPMYVGQTLKPENAESYLIQNASPVESKQEIPKGQYACGLRVHRCSSCGKIAESVELFLPVNGKEMTERYFLFEPGTIYKFKDFQ